MRIRATGLVDRCLAWSRLPPVLLAIALVSVFVFQYRGDRFLPGHHGFLSSHGLTIAAHLSPEHRFLMFNRMSRDEAGGVHYEVYNSFPIGAFAAMRLVTLPFQDDLGLQMSVAKGLMNLFLVAAAGLAYASIARLTADRWVAAAATLFAFSSYYCLYYNDMTFNDVPTLFGLLLTFHGMVVFGEEGRWGQLLVKSGLAILLGWQIYGLLVPFVILGCAREARASRSMRVVVRSPFFVVGVSTVVIGAAVLAANLWNEHAALDRSPLEVPTVERMKWRLGAADSSSYDEYAAFLAWPAFTQEQLYRIGRASIPALMDTAESSIWVKGLGAVVLVTALLGAWTHRLRVIALSLVLSGPCWAIPMRHFVTFHDFQSLFYVGIPLVFFSMVAMAAMKASRPAGLAFTLAALLSFSWSSREMNAAKAASAPEGSRLTADFQRISDWVGRGRTLSISGYLHEMGGAHHGLSFYLAGSYFQPWTDTTELVVSDRRFEHPAMVLLTPSNERVFLYRFSGSAP